MEQTVEQTDRRTGSISLLNTLIRVIGKMQHKSHSNAVWRDQFDVDHVENDRPTDRLTDCCLSPVHCVCVCVRCALSVWLNIICKDVAWRWLLRLMYMRCTATSLLADTPTNVCQGRAHGMDWGGWTPLPTRLSPRPPVGFTVHKLIPHPA